MSFCVIFLREQESHYGKIQKSLDGFEGYSGNTPIEALFLEMKSQVDLSTTSSRVRYHYVVPLTMVLLPMLLSSSFVVYHCQSW